MRRAITACVLLLFLCTLNVSGEDLKCRLFTVSDSVLEGTISFADDFFTVTTDDGDKRVRAEMVERIDLPPRIEVPDKLPHGIVILRDGQNLEGFFVEINDADKLGISLPECGAIKIPYDAIAGVLFWGENRKPGEERRIAQDFMGYAGKLDRLVLANGDAIEGIVLGITPETIRVERDNAELSFKRAEVSRLFFALSQEQVLRKNWHARVRSTYGNTFSVVPIRIENELLSGLLPFGEAVEIRLSEIRWMQFRNGASVHLSAMKPSKTVEKPFFISTWSYRINQSVGGRELSLGGKSYESGFGTHSYCRLDFEVSSEFVRFIARAGIDDESQGRGSVNLIVLGDDREIYNSGVIKFGRIVDINIDISGVKILSLVTDFGGDDDLGDHADWCDPRVIRQVE